MIFFLFVCPFFFWHYVVGMGQLRWASTLRLKNDKTQGGGKSLSYCIQTDPALALVLVPFGVWCSSRTKVARPSLVIGGGSSGYKAGGSERNRGKMADRLDYLQAFCPARTNC